MEHPRQREYKNKAIGASVSFFLMLSIYFLMVNHYDEDPFYVWEEVPVKVKRDPKEKFMGRKTKRRMKRKALEKEEAKEEYNEEDKDEKDDKEEKDDQEDEEEEIETKEVFKFQNPSASVAIVSIAGAAFLFLALYYAHLYRQANGMAGDMEQSAFVSNSIKARAEIPTKDMASVKPLVYDLVDGEDVNRKKLDKTTRKLTKKIGQADQDLRELYVEQKEAVSRAEANDLLEDVKKVSTRRANATEALTTLSHAIKKANTDGPKRVSVVNESRGVYEV